MKRDTTLFAQDLKVDVSGEEVPYDTSHIYTGEIYGTTDLCTQSQIHLICHLDAKLLCVGAPVQYSSAGSVTKRPTVEVSMFLFVGIPR